MHLKAITNKQLSLSIVILSFGLLTACQSSSVNKVVRTVPSPTGEYHVEVRQCRANDAMFGGATQVQVSVLKKGQTEQCKTFINALAQFDVNTINLDEPNNALQLQWLSNTELRTWHRSFGMYSGKDYIGADTQRYSQGKPIHIIFRPTP